VIRASSREDTCAFVYPLCVCACSASVCIMRMTTCVRLLACVCVCVCVCVCARAHIGRCARTFCLYMRTRVREAQ